MIKPAPKLISEAKAESVAVSVPKTAKPQAKAVKPKTVAKGINLDDNDPSRAFLTAYATEQGLSAPQIIQLKKIIQAESGWAHFRPDGRVKIGPTNDVGFGQISVKYQLANAKKMGLDIYKPIDNLKYTVYLYKTQGSSPWNASKSRWNS